MQYRTKRPNIIRMAIALGLLPMACHLEQDKRSMGTKHVDIAGFFQEQADSLQRDDPMVYKTVKQGAESEEKEIHIANWHNELDFFLASDINKADWMGSFRTDSTENRVTYTTQDEKIRTKRIEIDYCEGRIVHIHAQNSDSNWLYRSVETLDYYPDSLYSIHKKQQVRFLEEKEYEVTGAFKKK